MKKNIIKGLIILTISGRWETERNSLVGNRNKIFAGKDDLQGEKISRQNAKSESTEEM